MCDIIVMLFIRFLTHVSERTHVYIYSTICICHYFKIEEIVLYINKYIQMLRSRSIKNK